MKKYGEEHIDYLLRENPELSTEDAISLLERHDGVLTLCMSELAHKQQASPSNLPHLLYDLAFFSSSRALINILLSSTSFFATRLNMYALASWSVTRQIVDITIILLLASTLLCSRFARSKTWRTIVVSSALGISLGVLLFVFSIPIGRWFTQDVEIIYYCISSMRLYSIFVPMIAFSLVLKLTLLMNRIRIYITLAVAQLVMLIVVSYVLIFVIGWGMQGAMIAFIASECLSAIIAGLQIYQGASQKRLSGSWDGKLLKTWN